MPVVIAFLVYAGRILRKPMDGRLKKGRAGTFLLTATATGLLAVWVQQKPSGLSSAYFWGEVLGVATIYRTGQVLGVLSLLALLVLVAVSFPRAAQILRLPYHRWLLIHRLTGLFVALSLAHGLLLDAVIADSILLTVLYFMIGGAGLAAYAYEELVMRRRAPGGDYTIDRIDRPLPQVLELHLLPVHERMSLTAGQFVFLRVGGDETWREHPFTVAGALSDGGLRLTIRSQGRDTSRMYDRLQPGLSATVTGPYGMFDFTLGHAQQIWIAGGIGIAPFLSWLEVLKPTDPYTIDLFYSTSTETEAVYLAELHAAQQRLAPRLHVHPVLTATEGHLTGARVAATTDITPETHVFLCGPTSMVDSLSGDLHRRGIPGEFIHAEHFSFR